MALNYSPTIDITLSTKYTRSVGVSPAFTQIYRDASGIVWIFTADSGSATISFFQVSTTNGIIYTNQSTITASTRYTRETTASPNALAVYQDAAGIVWVATVDFGAGGIVFFKVSGTDGIIYTNQSTINSQTTYSRSTGTNTTGVKFYQDASGIVWLASADYGSGTVSFFQASGTDGIIYTNQSTITASTRYTYPAGSNIQSLSFYRDASGIVWIFAGDNGSSLVSFFQVSGSDGIIYTSQGTITASTKYTRGVGNKPSSIFVYRDDSGIVWIFTADTNSNIVSFFQVSTTNGIVYTNQSTITASTRYTCATGSFPKGVSVYKDINNVVWVATGNTGAGNISLFPISGTDGIIYTNQTTIDNTTKYTYPVGTNIFNKAQFYQDASGIVWLGASDITNSVTAFFQISNKANKLNLNASPNYLVTANNIAQVTSAIDYFAFDLGVLPRIFLQNYAYTYTRSSDVAGIVGSGSALQFTTSTADFNSGDATISSGATLRLGKKTTYTVGLIFQSGSTIEVYPDSDRSGSPLDLRPFTVPSGVTINAVSGTVNVIVSSTTGLTLGSGVTATAPTVSIVLSGIPTGANAIVGVIDLTTMAQSFPAITSGSATIPTNPAHSYLIACDARGYLRQAVTLAGNVPSYTFVLPDYTALYNAGVSRAANIAFNYSTYVVTIDDGTPLLPLADVFRTIEDYLATQQAIFFSTQPYPVIVDTGVGGVRQYLFFPYDFTANIPNPLRIKPKATNTTDPTLTDFVIVHVGSTAPLFTIFDFTGAGGRVIRFQTEAVAATVTVSGSGALTTAQAAQLAALNAALVSSGVFSAAALANAPSAGGGGLTAQQVRDALTLSTVATAAAGSIDAKLTAIPITPLLTADTRLNNLDAAISSRLPITGYLAPANTSILNAIGAIPTTPLLTGDTRLSNLDAAVSSRQATFAYTAPNNAGILAAIAAIPTTPLLAGDIRLNNLNAPIGNIPTLVYTGALSAIFSAIGAIPTTTLLTGDTRLNNLDAAISSRQATFTYTAPNNAGITTIQNLLAAIEGAGFDTSTDSLHAIRARGDTSWSTGIGSFSSADRATLEAIPLLSEIEASTIIAKEATANAAKNAAIANL